MQPLPWQELVKELLWILVFYKERAMCTAEGHCHWWWSNNVSWEKRTQHDEDSMDCSLLWWNSAAITTGDCCWIGFEESVLLQKKHIKSAMICFHLIEVTFWNISAKIYSKTQYDWRTCYNSKQENIPRYSKGSSIQINKLLWISNKPYNCLNINSLHLCRHHANIIWS